MDVPTNASETEDAVASAAVAPAPRPIAVNFHVNKACDSRCRFCFATFGDVTGQASTDVALAVIDALADAGCEKLNFAGGEPTLRRDLPQLVRRSKERGLVTSVVTNGFRLDALLDACADALDWVGLSVDSAREDVQAALGRGHGDHVGQAMRLAARSRALGVRIKLNSVVTALTWEEDLSALVRAIRPERWKVFQVLPMEGQNDGRVEDLLIDAAQLRAFVARHAPLAREGLGPIVEDNDAMRGSYVMVDPQGRFFGNATGRHVYSRKIVEVGVEAALAEVAFEEEKFLARGGVWGWG
jgi:radical S-adenosyl methionine domain-containing protein 2